MTFIGRWFRRAGGEAPHRLKDGDAFSLCRDKYGVTAREGEIIRLLLEGKDNKDIAARLFISDHTVKNHIHHIYQKLGIGNRVQLVKCFSSALEEPGPLISGGPAGGPRSRKLLVSALVIGLIALAGAAYLLFGPKKVAPPTSTPQRSIAVLPFVDLSATRDYEYLCDGISETLINALTRVEGLWVPARTSSFFFKGKAQDLQDIGRKLGVDTILEGSVQVAGDDLRITARLADVKEGRQIWSEIFNRKRADLFRIQDDITLKIVEALKVRILEERPVMRRYTEKLESYDLYMKGIYFYNKRGQENLEKALGFFRSAIAVDPQYALAYAWIAETYTVIGSWAYLSPREAYSNAREAAQKALEMDNSLAEAHSAMADVLYSYEYKWKEAEAEYREALRLNPRYAIAHSAYAQFLACQGRFEESLNEHARAEALDPLSLMIRVVKANALIWMGQYDRAVAEFDRIFEMDPGYAPAKEYVHQAFLRKLLAEGKFEDAFRECEKADDPLGKGIVYGRMGRKTEGRKIADEFIARSRKNPNDAYYAAIVLFALGEDDQGFEFLEKAYESHSRRMVYLKTAPFFGSVRTDLRFQVLLRKVGLGE
jgi:TolB-like protein/DNA-binding CsgD family transcriptional regulator/Tfp pilus assembly protein PilF